MKKFLMMILALLAGVQFAYSEEATIDWTTIERAEKVDVIGQQLLKENEIPVQVKFTVYATDDINAFANVDKEICVYTGLLNNVVDDNELAAVIGHEIGHVINSHTTKQSVSTSVANAALANVDMGRDGQKYAEIAGNVVMLKMSRTDEYEADVTAIDLLVKAGYNPLAMISFLYKISENYVDVLSTHPSGDKRTMYSYDYILYAYPELAKAGYDTISFQNFIKCAQPIVDARNANPVLLEEFNKEQEELRAKRLEKIEKYKTRGQDSGWDAAHSAVGTFKTINKQFNLVPKF